MMVSGSTNIVQTLCLNCNVYFSRAEFSPERCAAPNLNADTILQTFDRTCYEFHVTRGESYEKAQQICKSHGKYLSLCLFRVKIARFFIASSGDILSLIQMVRFT